jgi:hypothetical protein
MITRDNLNILRDSGMFISPEKAGIPFNDINKTQKMDGRVLPCDLIIKGTNRFVFWDKQRKLDGVTCYKKSEKPLILYAGRVNLSTGRILSNEKIPFVIDFPTIKSLVDIGRE